MGNFVRRHFADPYEAAEAANQLLVLVAVLLVVIGLPIANAALADAGTDMVTQAWTVAQGEMAPDVW